MGRNYQELVKDMIFFGAAEDVVDMVKNENIEILVDLREQATENSDTSTMSKWIHMPLNAKVEKPLALAIVEAVDQVVDTYHSGKKVGFYCSSGSGKVGSIAIGALLSLSLCETIDEAEKKVCSLRGNVEIKPEQREALDKLYQRKSPVFG